MGQESERPRGILTAADREYLVDNPDLNEHTEAQKRYRIRQRVWSAFQDFTLLAQHLSPEDRQQIFARADDDQLAPALQDTLGFVYQGCEDTERSFGLALRFGLEDAMARQGRIIKQMDLTFEMEIEEGISIADARALKRRGGLDALWAENLMRGEWAQLHTAGVLTDDEYDEYRSRLKTQDDA